MPQTKASIEKLQKDPKVNPGTIANLWYGYYNKVSLPLATIIFALVGAPLGHPGPSNRYSNRFCVVCRDNFCVHDVV